MVSYILNGLESIDEDIVENVIDGYSYLIAEQHSESAAHSIYEYIDENGCCYVIFNFWNIVIYKIKIAKSFTPNISNFNIIKMMKYSIDGNKSEVTFAKVGKIDVTSEKSQDALKRLKNIYIKNINILSDTIILTIFTVKQMTDEMMNDLLLLKNGSIDLAKFLEYEEIRRIVIVRLILIFEEHGDKYNFNNSFNDNLKTIFNTKEIINFNNDNRKMIIENIIDLDKKQQLINKIERGASIFNNIYNFEVNKL